MPSKFIENVVIVKSLKVVSKLCLKEVKFIAQNLTISPQTRLRMCQKGLELFVIQVNSSAVC